MNLALVLILCYFASCLSHPSPPPTLPLLPHQVRYSLVSSPSAEMTVTAISTSLTLTSLTPLTQYRIDVRARNSVDFSDYSSVVTLETSFEGEG